MEKRVAVVWVLLLTGSVQELCAGKFLDDHDNGNPYTGPLVNGITLQWNNKASREWAENDNNGCFPVKNERKEGQLICEYACTNNGVLSLVLQSSNRELSYTSGVFFRWTGTRSFYYMIVDMNANANYPHKRSLRLFKDTIPDTQDQLTNGILIAKNLPFPSDDKTFTVSVVLSKNEYGFF